MKKIFFLLILFFLIPVFGIQLNNFQFNLLNQLNPVQQKIIYCNSCCDCTEKIAMANPGAIIRLTEDIEFTHNPLSGCINFLHSHNITFHGGNHSIQSIGEFKENAINLNHSNNNVIKNITVKNTRTGIKLFNSHNNTIKEIQSKNNETGITVFMSSNNLIKNNLIQQNTLTGIDFISTESNKINNNLIQENFYGIRLSVTEIQELKNNSICNNALDLFEFRSSQINYFKNNKCKHFDLDFPFKCDSICDIIQKP